MAHVPAPADPAYDAHFAAVGRVVDMWAQLEFQIDRAIWQLADVEQMLGACITAQLIGVNGRQRALRALLALRGGSQILISDIGTFAGSLSGLQQRRHRAAHDPRMVHQAMGTLERLEITADKELVFGFQPESAESLKAIREKIAAKIREFDAIFMRIVAEINALPHTSQPILRRIVPVKKGGEDPATDA